MPSYRWWTTPQSNAHLWGCGVDLRQLGAVVSDEAPQFTRRQRAASAFAGTAAALFLVILVLSLLPDAVAQRWGGIVTQAILPVPFVFWRWPALIFGLAAKARGDKLK